MKSKVHVLSCPLCGEIEETMYSCLRADKADGDTCINKHCSCCHPFTCNDGENQGKIVPPWSFSKENRRNGLKCKWSAKEWCASCMSANDTLFEHMKSCIGKKTLEWFNVTSDYPVIYSSGSDDFVKRASSILDFVVNPGADEDAQLPQNVNFNTIPPYMVADDWASAGPSTATLEDLQKQSCGQHPKGEGNNAMIPLCYGYKSLVRCPFCTNDLDHLSHMIYTATISACAGGQNSRVLQENLWNNVLSGFIASSIKRDKRKGKNVNPHFINASKEILTSAVHLQLLFIVEKMTLLLKDQDLTKLKEDGKTWKEILGISSRFPLLYNALQGSLSDKKKWFHSQFFIMCRCSDLKRATSTKDYADLVVKKIQFPLISCFANKKRKTEERLELGEWIDDNKTDQYTSDQILKAAHFSKCSTRVDKNKYVCFRCYSGHGKEVSLQILRKVIDVFYVQAIRGPAGIPIPFEKFRNDYDDLMIFKSPMCFIEKWVKDKDIARVFMSYSSQYASFVYGGILFSYENDSVSNPYPVWIQRNNNIFEGLPYKTFLQVTDLEKFHTLPFFGTLFFNKNIRRSAFCHIFTRYDSISLLLSNVIFISSSNEENKKAVLGAISNDLPMVSSDVPVPSLEVGSREMSWEFLYELQLESDRQITHRLLTFENASRTCVSHYYSRLKMLKENVSLFKHIIMKGIRLSRRHWVFVDILAKATEASDNADDDIYKELLYFRDLFGNYEKVRIEAESTFDPGDLSISPPKIVYFRDSNYKYVCFLILCAPIFHKCENASYDIFSCDEDLHASRAQMREYNQEQCPSYIVRCNLTDAIKEVYKYCFLFEDNMYNLFKYSLRSLKKFISVYHKMPKGDEFEWNDKNVLNTSMWYEWVSLGMRDQRRPLCDFDENMYGCFCSLRTLVCIMLQETPYSFLRKQNPDKDYLRGYGSLVNLCEKDTRVQLLQPLKWLCKVGRDIRSERLHDTRALTFERLIHFEKLTEIRKKCLSVTLSDFPDFFQLFLDSEKNHMSLLKEWENTLGIFSIICETDHDFFLACGSLMDIRKPVVDFLSFSAGSKRDYIRKIEMIVNGIGITAASLVYRFLQYPHNLRVLRQLAVQFTKS